MGPLNAKTAFRRFPRTKPDVPSQGLITENTLRKNSETVNPIAQNSRINLYPSRGSGGGAGSPACARKAAEVTGELDGMRPGAAARTVRDGFAETLSYTKFPPEHRRRVRTDNGIERVNRESRRRAKTVWTFPDGNSALMLVTARLKYIAEHEWGKRRYLDMSRLEETDELIKKAED